MLQILSSFFAHDLPNLHTDFMFCSHIRASGVRKLVILNTLHSQEPDALMQQNVNSMNHLTFYSRKLHRNFPIARTQCKLPQVVTIEAYLTALSLKFYGYIITVKTHQPKPGGTSGSSSPASHACLCSMSVENPGASLLSSAFSLSCNWCGLSFCSSMAPFT